MSEAVNAPKPAAAVAEDTPVAQAASNEWVDDHEACDTLMGKGGTRLSRKCPGQGRLTSRMTTGALDLSYICPYNRNAPECQAGANGRGALKSRELMRVRAREKSFRSTEVHLTNRLKNEQARQLAQCSRQSSECRSH